MYVREASAVLVVAGIVISALAAGVSYSAETSFVHGEADKWVEALAEARSVQRVMAQAIVALSLSVAALGAYIIKLLSGVIRENTSELRMCRERREHSHTG